MEDNAGNANTKSAQYYDRDVTRITNGNRGHS